MESDHDYFIPKGGMPNQTSLVDLDRDRGILTPADRRLLTGESEIESGSTSERKARQRIRERIRNTMLDFYLLLNHLEERDLKQAFGQTEKNHILHDDVISVFPAALGFLYAASTAHPDDGEDIFAHRVRSGIVAAEVARKGKTVEVDVSLDIDRKEELEEIADRVRQKGTEADVSPKEMNALLEAGMIERERYGEIMENILQSE